MTEAEWLVSADPAGMLAAVRDAVSERKLRLCACGCVRRYWALYPTELQDKDREKVELTERHIEGRTSVAERELFGREEYGRHVSAYIAIDARASVTASIWSVTVAMGAGGALCRAAEEQSSDAAFHHGWNAQLAENCQVLRCIFGNPFRPVTCNPAWRTSDAVALARGIYDDRAFDRMPILADALQDAGCDNDDILNHCRDTKTPHARGCWVVDLVLGKA